MSPLRCPACRALNEQGPSCRRCKADLSLLFLLEDQRRRLLDRAYQALEARAWPEMLALAREAHELRRDEETARLVALGSLLRGDFATAWQAYSGELSPREESL